MADDTIPDFDEQQFSSAVHSSFVTTKRAWSQLTPDICRRVMTEDLWAQQESRMEAVQLDGARNIVEGLIISRLDIIGRRSLGLEDEVRIRLTVAGTDYIVCRHHHPHDAPTAEQVLAEHHAAVHGNVAAAQAEGQLHGETRPSPPPSAPT